MSEYSPFEEVTVKEEPTDWDSTVIDNRISDIHRMNQYQEFRCYTLETAPSSRNCLEPPVQCFLGPDLKLEPEEVGEMQPEEGVPFTISSAESSSCQTVQGPLSPIMHDAVVGRKAASDDFHWKGEEQSSPSEFSTSTKWYNMLGSPLEHHPSHSLTQLSHGEVNLDRAVHPTNCDARGCAVPQTNTPEAVDRTVQEKSIEESHSLSGTNSDSGVVPQSRPSDCAANRSHEDLAGTSSELLRLAGSVFKHLLPPLAKNIYKCPECGKSFSQKGDFNRHVRLHSADRPFKCEYCGKGFCESRNMIIHIRSHSGERPYRCNQCPKGFFQKGDLTRHLQLHTGERPYTCDLCGKGFSRRTYLTLHQYTHVTERPYTCELCGKGFTQKIHLTTHQHSHSGERPYTCELCGKSFFQRGHLTSHQRSHSGERPHACEKCGKTFSRKTHLTIHERSHSGERPFTCEQCGKHFSHRSNLFTHMRLHSGECPFTCDLCGRKFSQRVNLTTHQRAHSGERPFSCETCGKSFSQKSCLYTHMRQHPSATNSTSS